ncbi:MAG TPA: HAMP domain-containing protein, partial [Herminiimonas sp.]|nr:HAMP domain-containing protein [Herminiimonas sp.]
MTKLIGGLTVGRKLALIYFLDLTAVIFISGILIHEKFIAINFADKEIVGNHYIEVVREGLIAIAHPQATGDAPVMLSAQADAVVDAENRYGKEMGTAVLSRDFAAALRTVEKAGAAPSRRSANEVDAAFAKGRELLTRIGNQSNLILDPDLDSYYTMSLIVLRFPELLEVLDGTGDLVSRMAGPQDPSRQMQQTRFLILEGRLDAITKGIKSDYDEAFAASTPQLREQLQQSRDDLLNAIQEFRVASQGMAGIIPDRENSTTYQGLHEAAIHQLRAAWIAADLQLNRLLEARIDQAFSRMWLHFGITAVLLMIILSLVFFVARQIAIPIRNLARVADDVRRSGDYALRASWDSTDEIGRLVKGFNGMLQQLDHQRITQQEMVAQTRAAQAQRELVEAIP